jgi:hypothetical protein
VHLKDLTRKGKKSKLAKGEKIAKIRNRNK